MQARIVVALLLLVVPMCYAMIARRGMLGPSVLAITAIGFMVWIQTIPPYERLTIVTQWHGNQRVVDYGGGTLYLENGGKIHVPQGTLANIRNSGAEVERMKNAVADRYFLEPSTLWAVYLPDTDQRVEQKTMQCINDS